MIGWDIPGTAQNLASILWRNRVIVLAWLVIAAAAAFLRFSIVDLDPGRVFPDTPGYVRVAENNLFSQGFLAGERPFTLPLLYKLMGISSENYQSPAAIQAITAVQTGLAAVSWLVLGLAVAVQFRSALTMSLSLLTVQLFPAPEVSVPSAAAVELSENGRWKPFVPYVPE